MSKDEARKHSRFGDDWISIHEVVNSLPPVTIAPKLLKATFTQDLEYKYCVEEVAESDPIELLIDKTQKGPSYPSLPLELFQDQEPDKRNPKLLSPEDQFLLSKCTGTRDSDIRPLLDNKLFLSRRPVVGHDTKSQAKVLSSSESRYVSKPFSSSKYGPAAEDPDARHEPKSASQLADAIERKFQEANQADLRALRHPSNPELRAISMFDILPCSAKEDKLEVSLITFDTDVTLGRSDAGSGTRMDIEGSLLVKASEPSPGGAVYSQYIPQANTPDATKPECPGKTAQESQDYAGHTWVRNYETIFFSDAGAKLALLSFPTGPSECKTVRMRQLTEKIGLKRRRMIPGSNSETGYHQKKIYTSAKPSLEYKPENA